MTKEFGEPAGDDCHYFDDPAEALDYLREALADIMMHVVELEAAPPQGRDRHIAALRNGLSCFNLDNIFGCIRGGLDAASTANR